MFDIEVTDGRSFEAIISIRANVKGLKYSFILDDQNAIIKIANLYLVQMTNILDDIGVSYTTVKVQ